MNTERSVEITDQFADQLWRLHNLYWIMNKDGKKVLFQPNWAQVELLENMRQNHLVLKARQLGMSTFLQILGLDSAAFSDGFNAVTIAHEREALEKLFRRNVRFPYDHLPDGLREALNAKSERAHELVFSNDSSVSVSLSTRSGTVQYLHVSEFGKICAKKPLMAVEVVSGAFESVPESGTIVIESTAEGQHGYFYDYCQEALNRMEARRPPASGEWSLTFLPWWRHPEYVANPKGVVITKPLMEYFKKLEPQIGQKLGPARRAWYAIKWKRLGDKMKREHPSTPKEAFEQTLEGAYYAEQMTDVRATGRICKVPHDPATKVHTWWDLGVDDATAIWFVQRAGREWHAIDYQEITGEGLGAMARFLAEKAKERKFFYGEHIGPHDLKVRELGNDAKRRVDAAAELGVDFSICPDHSVADGIEAVRSILPLFYFDEEHCAEGIKTLDSYRKEWDEVRGTYRNKPLHDWASHGADAFRTGVVGTGTGKRPSVLPTRKPRKWA